MPAHNRPLASDDGPLSKFALDLRRLRDLAPDGRHASVDKVVNESGKRVSRAAIYSALSGRTLPSRDTLAVMVAAWAPRRSDDLATWNERRSQCERALAAKTSELSATSERLSSPDTATAGVTSRSLSNFGSELRKLRTKAGISLGETARRINYSKGQLSKVENGHKRPTPMMAKLLDDALSTGGQLFDLISTGG